MIFQQPAFKYLPGDRTQGRARLLAADYDGDDNVVLRIQLNERPAATAAGLVFALQADELLLHQFVGDAHHAGKAQPQVPRDRRPGDLAPQPHVFQNAGAVDVAHLS